MITLKVNGKTRKLDVPTDGRDEWLDSFCIPDR